MRALVVALALSTTAQVARADDGRPVFEAPAIEVVDRGPEDDAPPDAPPSALATRAPLDAAQAEGRSVAEVLQTLPSLHVRRLGALGAYSTLSIRGSTASQVTILVDGVPIAPSSDGTLSLDDLSVDAFEAVDVYRGVAPLAIAGGFAIGGVVDLRTSAVRAPLRIAATAGSFGTYRLGVSAPARVGRVRVQARAAVLRTDGDFEFYDDRGTRQNPDDDATARRRNADFTLLDTGGRASIRLDGGARVEASLAATAREAGVPGLGTFQADHARSRALHGLAAVSFQRPLPGGSITARLAARADATAFVDRDNEVGLGAQDRSDRTTYVEIAVPVALGLGGGLVELAPLVSVEGTAARDPIAVTPTPGPIVRRRVGLGAGFERSIAGAVSLRAAGTLAAVFDGHEIARSAIGSVALAAHPPARLEPAAGLGARIDLSPVTLRANATYTVRAPTFEELFGNSGAVQGDPTLEPERALGVDLGATLVGERVQATAAAYWQQVGDLVQFVQTSQRTARATNIGRARLRGLELGASARPWPWLGGRLALGLLDATNLSDIPSQHGRRVPGRPPFDLSAALEARAWTLALGVDTDVVAGNYLDPANLQEAPPRAFVGAVLRWSPLASLTVALSVKNLFDHRVAEVELHPPPVGGRKQIPQAVSDYGGFPLPGRAVFLTIRWTERNEEESR